MPTDMFIVVDGDFEILRHKKCKHQLIDPIKQNNKGAKINQDKIAEYIGPGGSKWRSHDENAKVVSQTCPKKANNTLFQGPRG